MASPGRRWLAGSLPHSLPATGRQVARILRRFCVETTAVASKDKFIQAVSIALCSREATARTCSDSLCVMADVFGFHRNSLSFVARKNISRKP